MQTEEEEDKKNTFRFLLQFLIAFFTIWTKNSLLCLWSYLKILFFSYNRFIVAFFLLLYISKRCWLRWAAHMHAVSYIWISSQSISFMIMSHASCKLSLRKKHCGILLVLDQKLIAFIIIIFLKKNYFILPSTCELCFSASFFFRAENSQLGDWGLGFFYQNRTKQGWQTMTTYWKAPEVSDSPPANV